jgi:hypothetical protein
MTILHRAAPLALATLVFTMGQTRPPPQPTPPTTTELSWGELQRLRAENAALKQKLQAAVTQLAATSQPATQPKEVVRTFTTMADILAKVPADLRPVDTAEWHKYTEHKFRAWWEEQLVGMKFEQTLPLSSARTDAVVRSQPLPWMLTCYFSGRDYTFFNKPQTWSISTAYRERIDEAAAKKWDKVKPGRLFKVTGTISNASISYRLGQSISFTVSLALSDMNIADP